MKNIIQYKGYLSKIEFDTEDLVLRGKIEGINDLITFETNDILRVEEEFKNAANVVKDDELKINDVAKLYQYIKEKIKSLEEEEE